MPELHYKVRVEESGNVSFEFVTAAQAKTRGLIAQVLAAGEANAYVQIRPQTYQSYAEWKKRNPR